MRHIFNGCKGALCGPVTTIGDTVVDAALDSDCDDCRAALHIGSVSQLGCHVRAPLDFTREPHPQAENILDYVRQRREY